MKNTKMFKAWQSLDSQAGTYWQPDQCDLYLAFIAGIILGAVLAFQF